MIIQVQSLYFCPEVSKNLNFWSLGFLNIKADEWIDQHKEEAKEKRSPLSTGTFKGRFRNDEECELMDFWIMNINADDKEIRNWIHEHFMKLYPFTGAEGPTTWVEMKARKYTPEDWRLQRKKHRQLKKGNWVVATQIFCIFTPNLGEIRSNLTSTAYFSNGLVQPPTRTHFFHQQFPCFIGPEDVFHFSRVYNPKPPIAPWGQFKNGCISNNRVHHKDLVKWENQP